MSAKEVPKLARLMARAGHAMVTVETKPSGADRFGPLVPGAGKVAVQLNTALAMLSAGAHMSSWRRLDFDPFQRASADSWHF